MELTINNITKQYGNVTVLDDVSYRFTPGIYGILGANGAGKTTLFRIICGLMRANCGNIQYDKDAFFFHSFFINIGFIFIFQLLIRVGMQLYCFIYIKHWKF